MQIPFVDLDAQYRSLSDKINQAIKHTLDTSSFIGGELVAKFEEDFARYLDAKYCIACANGTDALEIAMLALGIGKGDEVIVPASSWVSTASSVHTVGAKPVFVDVDTETYNLNPSLLEDKITERTQAIIPVHFYGQMADMKQIKAIVEKHGLMLIEDAAQAIGAKQNDQNPGAFGDFATFSFYPGKNLGAMGDGGAIITNEEVLANSARILARLGQKKKHDHVALGRNSRLDAMQAAILRVKLTYIDKWNKARNNIAKLYDSLLTDLPIQLPNIVPNNVSNFHIYAIQVPNRDRVLAKMREGGVQCQIHYPKALTDLPPLKPYVDGEYPVARQLAEQELSLPMYPEMTKEQVEYVAEALHKAI